MLTRLPALRLRLQLRRSRLFSLGRVGLPVNLAAVLYGGLMLVNIPWPRASVYDPAGGHWYLRWFSVVFVAGTLSIGVLAWLRQRGEASRVPAPRPAE